MELINNTLNEYLKEIEQKDNNKKVLSTGFYDLDYAIKGLKEGELIVIASRPAMGKTALEFNIAMYPIFFFGSFVNISVGLVFPIKSANKHFS